MNSNTFVGFLLLIAVGLAYAYGEFRQIFSDEVYLRQKVSVLEKNLQQSELKKALAEYQLVEFQQHVATLLPDQLQKRGERNFSLRSLASTTQQQTLGHFQMASARKIFNEGTRDFKAGQYTDAQKKFAQLIADYSFFPQLVEAYFLHAESLFQLRKFEEAIAVSEKMVRLYPESELTGFTLLRVGRIYEAQYRTEEAIEIYRTVLKSFPYRDVASQAEKSLRAVNL